MTLTGHPGSPVLDQIFFQHPLFTFSLLESLCTISIHVLLGLPRPPLSSTSISVHLFTQFSSAFRSACPNHHNLLLLTASTMLSIPSLFLESEFVHLSCNLTPHVNLTIVISDRSGFLSASVDTAQISPPYNTTCHTRYINSSFHFQTYSLCTQNWL